MKSVSRWLVPIAALVVSLAVSAAAYERASQAWDGVVSYESSYTGAPVPASKPATPVADRVVLVIVDGLRADAADSMSSLTALRRYGADLMLTAPQPSLSYPNWTTILSGTTPDYHGVVTNWHEGAAPVETLLDVADRAGTAYAVVGPSDIATLFPAATRADDSFFREWSDEYLSTTYVDATLDIARRSKPRLILLHLPDIDEAGHDYGGASREYAQTVARVDSDLRRLIEGLQDSRTAFIIVADHGHIDSGGHGGWEDEVVNVTGVIAGAGVLIRQGAAGLEDIAPTVAVLAGLPSPRHATGEVPESVLATPAARGLTASYRQRAVAVDEFAKIIREGTGTLAEAFLPGTHGDTLTRALEEARATRLASDRSRRAEGPGLWIALGAVAAMALTGTASWRALVAALAGSASYYGAYSALFFVVHGNRWSLSSFNSEDLIDAWMNQRLIEAALSGLVAVAVAAWVYPFLRRSPKGPSGRYLPGWLGLGPVTVLVTQATLALQIAWFEWAWGIVPEWTLPDLMWGFKFDLDLVQVTALGGAALLAPVVTFLVGRYHPKVRKTAAERA